MLAINKTSATLPFSCEQAFDLAADIESYPKFLSGWVSARILSRESDGCHVEQVIGLGPFRLQFTSKAVLHRPERIEVTSAQAPFRLFSLNWLIVPVAPAGCRVSVTAQVELRSRLLQRIVNEALPAAMDELITAFEARAHGMYRAQGPGCGAPGRPN
ncbi:MAG TPA: type II toxin-antitoxin system RatA family toxin [Steroidobacteraceae bacterium]|nr:type II toxin-antitoxin system RatA family toxin [Steroidobacteraceae bacterium]